MAKSKCLTVDRQVQNGRWYAINSAVYASGGGGLPYETDGDARRLA